MPGLLFNPGYQGGSNKIGWPCQPQHHRTRNALRWETLIVRSMESKGAPLWNNQSKCLCNWKQHLHLAPLPIHLQLGASFLIQNLEPSPRDAHVVNITKWWRNVRTWMPSSPKEWGEIRSAPVFHHFLFAASFQHHIQVFTCMQCANQPVRPIHEPFRSVIFLFRTPLFRYSHPLLLQIYMCFKLCLSNTYSACTARNNTKYALESRI